MIKSLQIIFNRVGLLGNGLTPSTPTARWRAIFCFTTKAFDYLFSTFIIVFWLLFGAMITRFWYSNTNFEWNLSFGFCTYTTWLHTLSVRWFNSYCLSSHSSENGTGDNVGTESIEKIEVFCSVWNRICPWQILQNLGENMIELLGYELIKIALKHFDSAAVVNERWLTFLYNVSHLLHLFRSRCMERFVFTIHFCAFRSIFLILIRARTFSWFEIPYTRSCLIVTQ